MDVTDTASHQDFDTGSAGVGMDQYTTPVLSSSAPEFESSWQEVKKRSKERTPKKKEVN